MMKRSKKIWFTAAASLIVIGLAMFAAVMTAYGWDFTELNTEAFESNSYVFSEEFDNITMNTDTADITFALSDDGKCRVECYEKETSKHFVTVKDGTLAINIAYKKAWYDYIGINFSTPKITVYLPGEDYSSLSIEESTGDIEIPKGINFKDVDVSLSTGDACFLGSDSESLKIKTSTGNICVENTTAGVLDLSVSTGKITLSDVTCKEDVNIKVSTGKANLTNVNCKNLTSNGSTGSITLNNVIATEKFSIKRSTGGVKLDGADAAEIFIKTDTGNVKGSLLTDKVFITETDTGRVDVPRTVTGGRCEIITDTGDIKITVNK